MTCELNLFNKELDINKYDKHLISKYILIFFYLKKNIYLCISRSFTFEIIKVIKIN